MIHETCRHRCVFVCAYGESAFDGEDGDEADMIAALAEVEGGASITAAVVVVAVINVVLATFCRSRQKSMRPYGIRGFMKSERNLRVVGQYSGRR